MFPIISDVNIAKIYFDIKQILLVFFMSTSHKVTSSKLWQDEDTRDPEEDIW